MDIDERDKVAHIPREMGGWKNAPHKDKFFPFCSEIERTNQKRITKLYGHHKDTLNPYYEYVEIKKWTIMQ